MSLRRAALVPRRQYLPRLHFRRRPGRVRELAGMGAGQAEAAIAAGVDDAESGCSEQMRCALAIDERDELALDVIARLRPMNRACLMRLPRGNSALSEKWKSGYGRGQPLTTSDNFNANRGPSRSLG